jgi:hypothetical protein
MNAAGKGFCKQLNRLALAIGLIVTVFPSARILAEGTLSTILSNGPTAKRINLVVLPEGYTTNELGNFLEHATNYVNSLLAAPPYQEYSNYFNAFAISVASVQSGSDHPGSQTNNTYFNSSFYSYGIQRLITIPPNNFDANYSHGQGKVDALLQTHMTNYHLVIMIVNDPNEGGSGNPDGTNGQPIITSLNPFYGWRTLLHESGHTLGKLADEYESGNPSGYVPSERPNSTAQTNRALIKWTAWIDTNTPLPTPEIEDYIEAVGLFEGAQYTNAGWYRPRYGCIMRDLNWPIFCEICSEQLVKSIYGLIRPIDSFSLASTNFSVYSTQALNFSVTALQPQTHDLTVQWYTNSMAVSGATNFTFQLLPKSLPSGTNKVRAVVHDPTELVRNDPTNLLSGSNTWTLNISLTDLSLVSAQYLAGSRFRLTVTGAAPQGFVIQASTNLSTWLSLTTNSLSGGKFDYTNSGLTNIPYRFFRTRSPP